jgi:hypothetical protein
MRVKTFFLTVVIVFSITSVSQAELTEEIGQVKSVKSMPIPGKIDIELSSTVTSKHMWHGMDLYDDHGGTLLFGTIIFGDSGFSAKIIDVYPMSSGFEESVERHYAGFYKGTLFQETPWTTNVTTSYYYNSKPNVADRKSDTQEFGVTFFWPKLMTAGHGDITPSYYVDYIWASTGNSNMYDCEGTIHVFGLAYDVEMPDVWQAGIKQGICLYGDLTYNDGFCGSTIEHDWSHAVLGISTGLKKGGLTVTPALNYQISMEDSVNPEDECWCTLNATYRF